MTNKVIKPKKKSPHILNPSVAYTNATIAHKLAMNEPTSASTTKSLRFEGGQNSITTAPSFTAGSSMTNYIKNKKELQPFRNLWKIFADYEKCGEDHGLLIGKHRPYLSPH